MTSFDSFLSNFELNVGRRGADDSEVVFAIALGFNSPANLLLLY